MSPCFNIYHINHPFENGDHEIFMNNHTNGPTPNNHSQGSPLPRPWNFGYFFLWFVVGKYPLFFAQNFVVTPIFHKNWG